MIQIIKEKCTDEPRWAEIFEKCYINTLQTTLTRDDKGNTFVLTGDIPAMWLRDSTAQIRPYLLVAKADPEVADIITGVIKQQMKFIQIDPYANAFNQAMNNAGHQDDVTRMNPGIWERKYEIDSLCFPMQLSYLFWKVTGETSHFDDGFDKAVDLILDVWEVEQEHEKSPYTFERDTKRKEDTLCEEGRGSKVGYTGMTWSGFRPSDDCCTYHYLVPANMFAVVVLGYLAEVYETILPNEKKKQRIEELKAVIDEGIRKYGIVNTEDGQAVFAYEVDGLGNYSLMDDANVPSLLSIPYLGYCDIEDEIYQATRNLLLSKKNPYFYQGTHSMGIGSSHTEEGWVWPIALAVQGLTTKDKAEKERMLSNLAQIDNGTGYMHESVNVNDPKEYTREWFSWANMMFCELLMDYFEIRIDQLI